MPKRGSKSRRSLLSVGDEVSVSIGLTMQVGERNFVKLDVGARGSVRQGESADTAHDRLFETCELTLNEKMDEYVREFNS